MLLVARSFQALLAVPQEGIEDAALALRPRPRKGIIFVFPLPQRYRWRRCRCTMMCFSLRDQNPEPMDLIPRSADLRQTASCRSSIFRRTCQGGREVVSDHFCRNLTTARVSVAAQPLHKRFLILVGDGQLARGGAKMIGSICFKPSGVISWETSDRCRRGSPPNLAFQ